MDFDPTAATGERKRSGPRWYSVIAFLVIAFLLLLNAIAMFANAEANGEEACYARARTASEIWSAKGDPKYGRGEDGVERGNWVATMWNECNYNYEGGGFEEK
tara:strand:+ start:143 stop:451 length:309 start_codon:yes stop_codon:yes gene_type:complete